MSWLDPNITIPVTPRITGDASNRSAQRLLAVVGQFGLDLDVDNPRYGRRDRDGDASTLETACNAFVRDAVAALGLRVEGARANDQVAWLASPEARQRGWATVTEHAAHGVAEEGMVAVVGWHSRGQGPGHVALVVPSLDEPGLWIAQAGGRCFSRGTLASGFGDRAVSFFVHP
jgi:hypothetical protein